MTRTTISGAAGFGRVDMSGLARRQLRMSVALVGFLAMATAFAAFAGGKSQTASNTSGPTAHASVTAARS